MDNDFLALVGVALGFGGHVPYIRDVLRGTTRPHVYTWFLWGLLSGIIFALQLSDQAGAGAYITLAMSVVCFLIFALALRQGNRDITFTDTLIFAAALVALGLWLIANQPLVSTILIVGAYVLAFVPTARKSWRKPEQETLSSYFLSSIRHGLGVLALQRVTLVTALFPAVLMVVNGLFVLLLIYRRRVLSGSRR